MKKWEAFETLLEHEGRINPDELSDLYSNLTDDLAFSPTSDPFAIFPTKGSLIG